MLNWRTSGHLFRWLQGKVFRSFFRISLLQAMKYGAMPILVNFTDSKLGNFVDRDVEDTKFSRYIKDTFNNMPLNQAIVELKNNPSKWDKKIADGMTKDFSWDAECCDIHISAYTAVKKCGCLLHIV